MSLMLALTSVIRMRVEDNKISRKAFYEKMITYNNENLKLSELSHSNEFDEVRPQFKYIY